MMLEPTVGANQGFHLHPVLQLCLLSAKMPEFHHQVPSEGACYLSQGIDLSHLQTHFMKSFLSKPLESLYCGEALSFPGDMVLQ